MQATAFVDDDTAGTAALYAGMSTDELERLKTAFQLDQPNLKRPESVAFAEGRLALIAAELAKR
jgi:hypothetical protein